MNSSKMYENPRLFMTACMPNKERFARRRRATRHILLKNSAPEDQDADQDKREADEQPPQFGREDDRENDQYPDPRYVNSD
jgi:hypothetical protein